MTGMEVGFLALINLTLYLSSPCINICVAGREIVNFLEHGLSFHVAQEMAIEDESDIQTRLQRAFLITDIHARHAGVLTSGATVAACLIKVC